jgi:hypothetical protein
MLNSKLLTTLDAFKLRDDKYTFLFLYCPTQTERFLFSNSKAFKTLMKFLVFGVSKLKSSRTIMFDSFALIENADFLPNVKFLFNLNE